MGFLLTLVYIALSLLSPKDLIPSLVEYRVELVVVIAALVVSAPRLLDANFFRIPQNYLLLGLFAAIFLSVAIGVHWPGGGFIAVQKFLSTSVVFYLIVLNCRSSRQLQALVILLTLVGAFYVVQGGRAYYAAEANINNVCHSNYDPHTPTNQLIKIQGTLELCNPLLEIIPVSDGAFAFRMRGLGFFKDPNELSQFLVMLVPLIWVGWRKRLHLRNIFFVLAPTAMLIWGMYLTHSRGGLIALVLILMIALKGRVNVMTAILAGVLAFGLMSALNFSGGREISVQAGSNRFMLWGDGLALFKSAPVFGVGYENFATANRGQTAHNSFIVCLAELGLFGYAFWVSLLVFTMFGLNALIASFKLRHGPPEISIGTAELDAESVELERWAEAIRLSIVAFLVAAFFLSRAYALTLYLALGMAVALSSLVSDDGEPSNEQPLWKPLGFSAGLGVATIVLVYLMIRIGNAMTLDKTGYF